MGSGKSTFGELLSYLWGFDFYDTDKLLEEGQKVPVSIQLVNNPVVFRLKEAELIARLVYMNQGIISLGGGAIEDPNTRALLQGKPVVLLDPGVDICWQRVQADTQHRPLAADYNSFVALYKRRLPLYLSVCRWHLTDNLPPEQLLHKLERLIRQG